MKFLGFIIFYLCIQTSENDLMKWYRDNLAYAPSNKHICYEAIKNLDAQKQNAIILGYKGAYEMIKANHQINPYHKLKSFNNGKKLLEQAINLSPKNIELRYIRYAIQLSIPKFLGYHHNIKDDKIFMLENKTLANSQLQKDLNKLMEKPI